MDCKLLFQNINGVQVLFIIVRDIYCDLILSVLVTHTALIIKLFQVATNFVWRLRIIDLSVCDQT